MFVFFPRGLKLRELRTASGEVHISCGSSALCVGMFPTVDTTWHVDCVHTWTDPLLTCPANAQSFQFHVSIEGFFSVSRAPQCFRRHTEVHCVSQSSYSWYHIGGMVTSNYRIMQAVLTLPKILETAALFIQKVTV